MLTHKGVNLFLTTLLGNDNPAIMANSSSSSGMMALEGLSKELLKKTLRPHYYRVTEQGVIMMKISVVNELRMYDLPKHNKSIASVISGFLNFMDGLINNRIDPIHIIPKSSIEKPANNPCETLPNVAGQDEIRPFQAEIVDLKSPSKSIEIVFATSMLGCQQGKDKTVGCDKTDPTGSKTGLIASSRVLQNKLKPNMVKLKKPKIGVWKTV